MQQDNSKQQFSHHFPLHEPTNQVFSLYSLSNTQDTLNLPPNAATSEFVNAIKQNQLDNIKVPFPKYNKEGETSELKDHQDNMNKDEGIGKYYQSSELIGQNYKNQQESNNKNTAIPNQFKSEESTSNHFEGLSDYQFSAIQSRIEEIIQEAKTNVDRQNALILDSTPPSKKSSEHIFHSQISSLNEQEIPYQMAFNPNSTQIIYDQNNQQPVDILFSFSQPNDQVSDLSSKILVPLNNVLLKEANHDLKDSIPQQTMYPDYDSYSKIPLSNTEIDLKDRTFTLLNSNRKDMTASASPITGWSEVSHLTTNNNKQNKKLSQSVHQLPPHLFGTYSIIQKGETKFSENSTPQNNIYSKNKTFSENQINDYHFGNKEANSFGMKESNKTIEEKSKPNSQEIASQSTNFQFSPKNYIKDIDQQNLNSQSSNISSQKNQNQSKEKQQNTYLMTFGDLELKEEEKLENIYKKNNSDLTSKYSHEFVDHYHKNEIQEKPKIEIYQQPPSNFIHSVEINQNFEDSFEHKKKASLPTEQIFDDQKNYSQPNLQNTPEFSKYQYLESENNSPEIKNSTNYNIGLQQNITQIPKFDQNSLPSQQKEEFNLKIKEQGNKISNQDTYLVSSESQPFNDIKYQGNLLKDHLNLQINTKTQNNYYQHPINNIVAFELHSPFDLLPKRGGKMNSELEQSSNQENISFLPVSLQLPLKNAFFQDEAEIEEDNKFISSSQPQIYNQEDNQRTQENNSQISLDINSKFQPTEEMAKLNLIDVKTNHISYEKLPSSDQMLLSQSCSPKIIQEPNKSNENQIQFIQTLIPNFKGLSNIQDEQKQRANESFSTFYSPIQKDSSKIFQEQQTQDQRQIEGLHSFLPKSYDPPKQISEQIKQKENQIDSIQSKPSDFLIEDSLKFQQNEFIQSLFSQQKQDNTSKAQEQIKNEKVIDSTQQTHSKLKLEELPIFMEEKVKYNKKQVDLVQISNEPKQLSSPQIIKEQFNQSGKQIELTTHYSFPNIIGEQMEQSYQQKVPNQANLILKQQNPPKILPDKQQRDQSIDLPEQKEFTISELLNQNKEQINYLQQFQYPSKIKSNISQQSEKQTESREKFLSAPLEFSITQQQLKQNTSSNEFISAFQQSKQLSPPKIIPEQQQKQNENSIEAYSPSNIKTSSKINQEVIQNQQQIQFIESFQPKLLENPLQGQLQQKEKQIEFFQTQEPKIKETPKMTHYSGEKKENIFTQSFIQPKFLNSPQIIQEQLKQNEKSIESKETLYPILLESPQIIQYQNYFENIEKSQPNLSELPTRNSQQVFQNQKQIDSLEQSKTSDSLKYNEKQTENLFAFQSKQQEPSNIQDDKDKVHSSSQEQSKQNKSSIESLHTFQLQFQDSSKIIHEQIQQNDKQTAQIQTIQPKLSGQNQLKERQETINQIKNDFKEQIKESIGFGGKKQEEESITVQGNDPEISIKTIFELNKWMDPIFQKFVKNNFSKQQKKDLIQQLSKQIQSDNDENEIDSSYRSSPKKKLESKNNNLKSSTDSNASPSQLIQVKEIKSELEKQEYLLFSERCEEQLKKQNELNESGIQQKDDENKRERMLPSQQEQDSFEDNGGMTYESKILLKDIYDDVQNALKKYDFKIQENQKNKSIRKNQSQSQYSNPSNNETPPLIQADLSQGQSNSEAQDANFPKCNSLKNSVMKNGNPFYNPDEKSMSINVEVLDSKIQKNEGENAENAFNMRRKEIYKSLQNSSKVRKHSYINQKPMNHSQSKVPIPTPTHIRTPVRSFTQKIGGDMQSSQYEQSALNSSQGGSSKIRSQNLINKILSPKNKPLQKQQNKNSFSEFHMDNQKLEDSEIDQNYSHSENQQKNIQITQKQSSPKNQNKQKFISAENNNFLISSPSLNQSNKPNKLEICLKDLAKKTTSPINDASKDDDEQPLKNEDIAYSNHSQSYSQQEEEQSIEKKQILKQSSNNFERNQEKQRKRLQVKKEGQENQNNQKLVNQSKSIQITELESIQFTELKKLSRQGSLQIKPSQNKTPTHGFKEQGYGEMELGEVRNFHHEKKNTENDSLQNIFLNEDSKKYSSTNQAMEVSKRAENHSSAQNDKPKLNIYQQKRLEILNDIQNLDRQIELENKQEEQNLHQTSNPTNNTLQQQQNSKSSSKKEIEKPSDSLPSKQKPNSKDIRQQNSKRNSLSQNIKDQQPLLNFTNLPIVPGLPQSQSFTEIQENFEINKPSFPHQNIQMEKQNKQQGKQREGIINSPKVATNQMENIKLKRNNQVFSEEEVDQDSDKKESINLYKKQANEGQLLKRTDSVNFHDRNQKWIETKKSKIEKTQNNQFSEKMKECTFKPLTNKVNPQTKQLTPENKPIPKPPLKSVPTLKQPLPVPVLASAKNLNLQKQISSNLPTDNNKSDELQQQQGVQSPIVKRYSEIEFWSQSDASVFRVINDLDTSYQQELNKEIKEVLDIISGLSQSPQDANKNQIHKKKKSKY